MSPSGHCKIWRSMSDCLNSGLAFSRGIPLKWRLGASHLLHRWSVPQGIISSWRCHLTDACKCGHDTAQGDTDKSACKCGHDTAQGDTDKSNVVGTNGEDVGQLFVDFRSPPPLQCLVVAGHRYILVVAGAFPDFFIVGRVRKGRCVTSSYRYRRINSLDVTFFHKDFSGFGTQCFHLTFLDHFAPPQLFNLPI